MKGQKERKRNSLAFYCSAQATSAVGSDKTQVHESQVRLGLGQGQTAATKLCFQTHGHTEIQ